MTTAVPDREQLAQGKLVLLREDDPDFCSARVNLWRYGIKLADESTWRQWRRFRWVELWQAVALQLFLDPDTVPWHSLGVRAHQRTSIGQLFGDRMRLALRHVEHESLPILAEGDHPRRAKVRPWEFAAWCDDIGQPCPEQIPRTDPKAAGNSSTAKARRSPPSSPEYLRQADLIPALVPFSPATLWRHVKCGKFPAPVKLSSSITAWRRADYEAWAASHAPTPKATQKPKSR